MNGKDKGDPQVYFIGAGPGDPELLTIKARTIIDRADVLIYADSLVHPTICASAKPGAAVHTSSDLNLEQIIALMLEAVTAAKIVARIQSGDPSVYGATSEQMAILDRLGISYQIIPGVSAGFAAAARLGIEYTVPGVAQSVIFTRLEGNVPMPEREKLRDFAAHQTTLLIFLSITRTHKVVEELLAGGYPPETPVAVIYRATWEDEVILRGTIASISQIVREAKLTRQALIVVGWALDPAVKAHAAKQHSNLYDSHFTHLFRKGLAPRGGRNKAQ